MKLRRSKEKILTVVWLVVVGCGLTASLAIFTANTFLASATSGKPRKLNSWDWGTESLLYFSQYKYKYTGQTVIGEQGTPTQNYDLQRQNQPPKYWQAINQDYGLGYINFEASARGIDRICSSVIYFPEITGGKTRLNSKQSLDLYGEAGPLYQLPAFKREVPNHDSKTHEENICYFGANENIGTRNDMNFVDHLAGAQKMDKLYDVREYVSAAYGKGKVTSWETVIKGKDCPLLRIKGVNNPNSGTIGTRDDALNGDRPYGSVSRNCQGTTILEFHFYPENMLRNLDESLKFTKLTYRRYYHYNNWECVQGHWEPTYDAEGKYSGSVWVCDRHDYVDRISSIASKYYNVYINGSSTITYYCHRKDLYNGGPSGTNYTTSDLEACFEGTFEKYYLTSFEQIRNIPNGRITSVSPRTSLPPNSSGWGSTPNNRPYIAHDVYNQYLESKEEKNFDGFMAVDDIDGHGEGYTPLIGVNRVYLSPKTRVIRRSIPSKFKNTEGNTWYRDYCTNNRFADRNFCQYEWYKGTNVKSSSSKDPNTTVYMQYTSTPSAPLTLAYYTNGHTSGITSDGVPIIYVVEDIQGYSDGESALVDKLKTILGASAARFKVVYGEELSATIKKLKSQNIIPDDIVVNENTILIYFEAARSTEYDPYTINREILGVSAEALPWYRDPNLRDYIEPKVEDEPENKKNRIIGIETDSEWQTKNVTVYFTKISRLVEDYRSTCYSGNTSTKP